MREAPDLIIVSECDDEKDPELRGKFFADIPGIGRTDSWETAKRAYTAAVRMVANHRASQEVEIIQLDRKIAQLDADIASLRDKRFALQDRRNVVMAGRNPAENLAVYGVLDDQAGYAWGVNVLDEDTQIEAQFGRRVRSVYFRENLLIRPVSPKRYTWFWGFGRRFD